MRQDREFEDGPTPVDQLPRYKDYYPRYLPLWRRILESLLLAIMAAVFAREAGSRDPQAVFIAVAIAVLIARSV